VAPTAPRVAAVVVNWNGADDTIRCLGSLASSADPIWHTYVVDNASTDDSVARISAVWPRTNLLVAGRNLGYAGAFNLGCARALADGAEFVLFLNNDVVVDPGCLGALLAAEPRIQAAILSPKILYLDRPGTIWYAGGYFDWDLESHHIGQDEPDDGRYDFVHPIEWATGCALFFSALVARRVGGMDERYFLYLEDVDWSLRARRRGIALHFVPGARVHHAVSRSVDRLERPALRYYAWRNWYLLVREHGDWLQRAYAWADLATRFVKIATRNTLCPAYRRDPLYRARTRALRDVVAGRFGEYAEGQSPSLAVEHGDKVAP
jgi:GT2 family glycosyltransferase